MTDLKENLGKVRLPVAQIMKNSFESFVKITDSDAAVGPHHLTAFGTVEINTQVCQFTRVLSAILNWIDVLGWRSKPSTRRRRTFLVREDR